MTFFKRSDFPNGSVLRKKARGFTGYICVGPYAGWALFYGTFGVRLLLGRVCFAVLFVDVEITIALAAAALDRAPTSGQTRTEDAE